jgi:hypothetical protein
MAMRQILHDVIRTDRAAAKLIASLPDDPEAPLFPSLDIALLVGVAMETIASWPLWTTAEGPAMVDTFARSSGALQSMRIAATRQRQSARVSMIYRGDGISRTFPAI